MTVATWSMPSMGGRLTIAIDAPESSADLALDAARLAGRRVNAWADRLTRFTQTSDLARLNGTSAPAVEVRPTLAATLQWARVASERTHGIVDPTLLDARLSAESGRTPTASDATGWSLTARGRTAIVSRGAGVRFDLDGLAKGWLADRAAALLEPWPGVAVDADGDIALRADRGTEWFVDIADPRAHPAPSAPSLATLRITGGAGWSNAFGVATSGTSVHRWTLSDGRSSHHLIDPRTGSPAETDVVQATIVAPTAREAEVIAKAAVILGSDPALDYLARSAALAAVLLLESGELACLPGIEAWLA